MESQDIYATCADVLNAFLNDTDEDADKFINKIESKLLKEKFMDFGKAQL